MYCCMFFSSLISGARTLLSHVFLDYLFCSCVQYSLMLYPYCVCDGSLFDPSHLTALSSERTQYAMEQSFKAVFEQHGMRVMPSDTFNANNCA